MDAEAAIALQGTCVETEFGYLKKDVQSLCVGFKPYFEEPGWKVFMLGENCDFLFEDKETNPCCALCIECRDNVGAKKLFDSLDWVKIMEVDESPFRHWDPWLHQESLRGVEKLTNFVEKLRVLANLSNERTDL